MALTEVLKELKRKEWVNLSHAIDDTIPRFSAFNKMSEATLYTVEKDGFFAKEYNIPTQYGTHIDAPVHFSDGKRYLHELTLKELFLPLYVIHKENEVASNPDYRLSLQDVLDFEATYGAIPAESFVAFSSGWANRWQDTAAYYNLDNEGNAHTPGWSMEALKYLFETRNITAIGHETLDTDSAEDFRRNNGLIGELYVLQQDKYQVEVMNNLDQIPATGAIISVNFPNILNAPGFPARVFAILP